MLVIFINVYKGREYGDLAANIGPINEKPFTNIIPSQPTMLIISNFSKESIFRKFKTSCLSWLGGCEQSHVAGRTCSGRLEKLQRSL